MPLSVIVPVYNGAPWLAATLDSALAQSLPADEIVIVDDGSTDASPDILRAFGDRLRVIRQPNAGVAAARNAGLAQARGDLICFLDQDDLWPADRNRLLVEALAADPAADLAAGRVEILWERAEPPTRPEETDTLHRQTLLGSLCVRRSVFERLGPLSTAVGYGDDLDFAMLRREAGLRTVMLDAVTLIYRIHDTNTSIDREVSKDIILNVLQRSLRRRRGA
ncbi:glycosyltransferase family A protein [Rhodoplanes sp. TEM]|uniref:Glycosyltransferase family A protein n=1 Tax=Rhodoplanes tepidamans TaxID=200616 RepID=A0ABT5J3R7_RHOTP|nr:MULTISPECIES: glycosyltransferase family A protein [Rhodoplanes]MDC7784292.1 glycosyltransferase family A protein [Rhodoplanes tepidamans]MDC7983684.1 glycosyltransferase family A protein [Rhodoplanes sp. TEM]MDQ0353694.1 glycosyltransferase involved in cell wall biosynthesis [Rhodoplanes tepidamans]